MFKDEKRETFKIVTIHPNGKATKVEMEGMEKEIYSQFKSMDIPECTTIELYVFHPAKSLNFGTEVPATWHFIEKRVGFVDYAC